MNILYNTKDFFIETNANTITITNKTLCVLIIDFMDIDLSITINPHTTKQYLATQNIIDAINFKNFWYYLEEIEF